MICFLRICIPLAESAAILPPVDGAQNPPNFGEKEAKVAANIRATLEKRGTSIGPYDILIAGTALTHQAILVSRNTTKFERVNKLQIENWY